MEGSKNRFTIVIYLAVFLLSFTNLFGQSAYRKITYDAYVAGQMHTWANVIFTIESSKSELSLSHTQSQVVYSIAQDCSL